MWLGGRVRWRGWRRKCFRSLEWVMLTGGCRWMGDRYEVVRVGIEIEEGDVVDGCCFAFCGDESQLEDVDDGV